MSSVDPYARTTCVYFCQHCTKRSPFPLSHPTRGYVCRHCLHPFGAVRKPPRIRPAGNRAPPRRKAHQRPKAQKRGGNATLSSSLLKIAQRDGWCCWLCGGQVDPNGPYEHRASVDHVVPRAEGGTRVPENVRLAHQSCNEYRAGGNVVPFRDPLVP